MSRFPHFPVITNVFASDKLYANNAEIVHLSRLMMLMCLQSTSSGWQYSIRLASVYTRSQVLLKFYETVFHFWMKRNFCFVACEGNVSDVWSNIFLFPTAWSSTDDGSSGSLRHHVLVYTCLTGQHSHSSTFAHKEKEHLVNQAELKLRLNETVEKGTRCFSQCWWTVYHLISLDITFHFFHFNCCLQWFDHFFARKDAAERLCRTNWIYATL